MSRDATAIDLTSSIRRTLPRTFGILPYISVYSSDRPRVREEFTCVKMATGGDRVRGQNRRLLGEEDASMVFETSAGVQVVPTFDSMGLRDDLLRGIYAYGEVTPPLDCDHLI